MNEASGSKWLLGDLETCQLCAMGNAWVGKKKKWQDFVYNSSLFSFLVKGMTAFSALQRNLSQTLIIMVWDVRETQTLFSIEQVISKSIKSVFLKIP